MKIILAIIIFSLIVLFHELGHFLLARKNNVKVNEFSLGLGPTLISWGKGETKYCLKLLPFGGACVMEGEDSESDDERAFQKKTPWEKIQIVAAGPIFNFIMAYILSVIFIGCVGFDAPVITGVTDGYSAKQAGLQPGDQIVELDNYNVHFYQEVSLYIMFHEGQDIEVTYLRDGQKFNAVLTPIYSEEAGRYLMGIERLAEREKAGIGETLLYGAYEIKYQVYIVFNSLKMLFTGKLGLDDMSGPVGIVSTIGDVYDQSIIEGIYYVVMNMISIAILLSANLGVMNLIPFPALDGGRLLLLIIELITKKKLPEKVENYINLVGFGLLMALMMFIMYNDITKLMK